MKVLICDNESQQVDILTDMCKKIVLKYNWAAEITGITDVSSLERYDTDILILDIEMPGESGIEIKDRLSQHGEKPYIIFATNYEEYMPSAFNRNVIGYMLKPVKDGILETMLCKAVDLLGNDIIISLEYGEVISTKEIVSIFSKGGYSNILGNNDKVYSNLRKSLKQWETELEIHGFIRISENTLINCRYIEDFGKTEIRVTYSQQQSKEYKLSRRRRIQAYEKYMNYRKKMAKYA